jgi:SAM-dependent methyltransferase
MENISGPRTIDFEKVYQNGAPGWDTGRPQPTFASLVRSGAISGKVLDVGCGTGEHVLMAAAMGLDATGIDIAPAAIAAATAKATQRNQKATFLVHDVLRLPFTREQFDTVIDAGLFHVLDDTGRQAFATGLASTVRPGGRYLMMCVRAGTIRGPRLISQEDIRATFADGWRIDSIEPVTMETARSHRGVDAWLATITRA